MTESKLMAAKSYVQEHLDELTPEMRAAVEDLLTFLAEPKIEYIDERHLKFNNLTFCKNKAGYYKTAISLHQCVWMFHNGEVPKGCGIHHGEFGKDCNEIYNLTMKTNSEHATWHNTHDFITVKCTNCGKEFQTRKANRGIHRFCFEECKREFDNRTYLRSPQEKTCVICGKKFYTRTQNAKTCSRPCRNTLVGKTRREREAARKQRSDS